MGQAYCGFAGEARPVWPLGPEVHVFLGIVYEQHLEHGEQRAVAAVILATVLEVLLEEHLRDLLDAYRVHTNVVRVLLDACRGRDRRIALYNQLADRPFSEAMAEGGMKSFLAGWKNLAEHRNVTVHGDLKAYFSDSDVIRYVRDNCLRAFAVVNAEVRRMARSLESST